MKLLGAGAVIAAAIFLTSWLTTPTLGQVVQSRTAGVSTTACGVASGTSGTAILLGESMLLTAAHLVIGAGSVEVDVDGTSHEAEIIGLDPRTDLALLEAAGVQAPQLQLGRAQNGEEVVFAPNGADAQSVFILSLIHI